MPLSPEQLALRKTGLGGSEIAAVAGIHPYLTPLDVYLEKIGLKEDVPNRYKDWGNRLEYALGMAYGDRMFRIDPVVGPVSALSQPGTIVARTAPWMLATPDFLVTETPGKVELQEWGLECKVRGAYDAHRWGPDSTDQVPDEVAAQCHWGMMVTGLKRWDIAALLGGNDFRVYTLHFDESIAHSLMELGARFWHEHVACENPPTIDGSKSAANFVKRLFPSHDEDMIAAKGDHDQLCYQLRLAKREFQRAKAEYEMWCNRVKAAIGPHAGILGRDYKVTWKKSKDGEATNWESVAKGLLPLCPEEQRTTLVRIQTNPVPGSRRFLTSFGDDDE